MTVGSLNRTLLLVSFAGLFCRSLLKISTVRESQVSGIRFFWHVWFFWRCLFTHTGFLFVSLLTHIGFNTYWFFVCVSFNSYWFVVCVAFTAYMIWTGSEGREAVKKSDPDLKPTEIMSKMGALWREMSAEDKKKWEVGCTVSQCVAVCRSVSQCAATCCTVLQICCSTEVMLRFVSLAGNVYIGRMSVCTCVLVYGCACVCV